MRTLWTWLHAVDRILRGEATTPAALAAGDLDVPVFGLCVVIDALGLLYGACMGVFGVVGGGRAAGDAWRQMGASMLKVPALFLLTLGVTLPSLYVFNAMVGSRLVFRSMVRLLVAALAVILAVLASIGPIVAFFSVTTTSYPFIVLLNVLIYAVAGCLGMAFLLQSLHRLAIARLPVDLPAVPMPVDAPPIDFGIAGDEAAHVPEPAPVTVSTGPLAWSAEHVLGRHVRTVFRIWVVVFALVGGQMAWVLRPFIGHPHAPFVLFRHTESNFFEGVYRNWAKLFDLR